MKKISLLFVFVLTLCASQFASARSWTCNATIFQVGTSKQYTPPTWRMSGGILVDREKRCRQHIERTFLTSNIYKSGTFIVSNTNSQVALCNAGGATFRVEYGFDRRPKSWQLTRKVAPSCKVDCQVIGFQ